MTYKIINKNTVLISQPILIQTFGRSSAQILSQIHYWTEKKQGIIKDGIRWIYNTAKDLADQICLSQRQVERLIQNLKKLGIIKVEHFNKYARTNYYAIDYDRLNALISVENDTDKMSVSDRQNVGIYTKNINKELNNKSEALEPILESSSYEIIQEQVEQVINTDLKNIRVEEKEPLLSNFHQEEIKVSNTTVQDMLSHWNKWFPNAQSVLSKDLAKLLMGAFIHRFDKNMDRWKFYCEKIQSSSYLTGEKFTLSLLWALRFSTIDRILKGDLGVKTFDFKPSEQTLEAKALEHIKGVGESDVCKQDRYLILKKLGAATYVSWFTQVDFLEQEGRVVFKTHNQFVEDYIGQKFGDLFYGSK